MPAQADVASSATGSEEPATSPAASGSSTLRPGDAATSASAQSTAPTATAMPTAGATAAAGATQTAGPIPTSGASPTAVAPTGTAVPSGAAAQTAVASPSETAPPSEIHEEIPEIPPRIRESIRGHVRVAVRLIVDKEGSVFAALVDEPGPSRYFERLAIEAAKKWTFPPLDTTGSRLELVRFDFTRQGATGRAVEIE
jgi:TonB family protein